MAQTVTKRTQAERRAATRRELLTAAKKLIAERGFAEASLSEIADSAGVTKGALYHHFASKEELFLALLDEHFQERIDAATRIAASPATEAPQRLVTEIPFDRRWNLLFLEFVVRAARDARFRRELRKRLRRLREQSALGLASFLEREGIETRRSPEELAVIIAALGNGLAMEAVTDAKASTDPLYAAGLGLMLDGVIAQSTKRL
jgi:AcrR family transcriptional regulator